MATILYVEDHPPARLLMQAIISEMTSHELVLADCGAEACRLAVSTKPALYILDLDLPDTDGLSLVADLMAVHASPVIIVSAYAEAVEQTVLSDSVSNYLAKPLDPDHVARTIQRTLAG
ncbi:MAG: response regulator [Anaerolineae bacterium]|nr:response regulator [Anaerolineae bacterium]